MNVTYTLNATSTPYTWLSFAPEAAPEPAKSPSPWDGPWRIIDGLAGARYWVRWLRHGKHRALVRGPVVVEPDHDETSMTPDQFEALIEKGEHVTGAGPCPACGAEWAYDWTYPGWDGALPCTRATTYIECPDCHGRFR